MSAATSIALLRGSITRIGSCISGSSALTSNTTLSTRKRFERYPMEIKPIRTNANYRAALKEVESLMTAKANTPAGHHPGVLTTFIEAYQRAHFPLELPDAGDAIKVPIEQSG